MKQPAKTEPTKEKEREAIDSKTWQQIKEIIEVIQGHENPSERAVWNNELLFVFLDGAKGQVCDSGVPGYQLLRQGGTENN